MAYNDLSRSEQSLTYGVLVAGAVVFAFPFLWLLATSAKVEREMSADKVRLLPRAPRPQWRTPYIDRFEFDSPACPEGVPEAVWEAAAPRIEAELTKVLDAWRARLPGGAKENPPPGELDAEAYRLEMVEGLSHLLSGRISDDARSKAVEFEREKREKRTGEIVPLSDAALGRDLSEEAVRVGADAVVDSAANLVKEKMLGEVFDACYRRFSLNQVRILTKDYETLSLYTGKEWRVVQGEAELVSLDDKGVATQEVRLRYAPGRERAVFSFSRDLPRSVDSGEPVRAADIERAFVGYRGDASWARISFEVIRDGHLFRAVGAEHLYEREGAEQELRWPGGEGDPMDRRLYAVLEPVGPAPEGSPDFEVRMIVEKVNAVGAWWAKLTRNYRVAFKEVPFARYIATSFALTILNVILAIFSCTLTGYAFARLQWPGRDLCFGILLATMMIPAQVVMIPSFLVMKWLGWYNTLLPLWVPAAFGSAFFIFLLRQFFKNVPTDLEDAARIDGCGFLRIYWHVMMPLVKPTIATIAIFTFMGVWNNFMGPLIYVNDERLFPLALGLFKFQIRSGASVGLMMAGSFVMTLPIITLFFFVQRYFIQGISLTGVKG